MIQILESKLRNPNEKGGCIKRVKFTPDFTSANPYQKLLAKALDKNGINVSFEKHAKFMYKFWRYARKYKDSDVLHLHWTEPLWVSHRPFVSCINGFFLWLDFLYLKICGIKLVWTMHNIVKHDSKTPKIETFFNSLYCVLYDQIIVHCENSINIANKKMLFFKNFKKKTHVIPHGPYTGSYENRITKADAKAALNLKSSQTVFLFIGALRPYKGIIKLINTFKTISSEDYRLIIAGQAINDNFKKSLLEAIGKDSRIISKFHYIPDNKIQLYMNASDIVVLPYQNVLTSGALYLAMSYAKPVIAPAMGCNMDIDSRGVMLYDLNDPDALLKAMIKMTSHSLDSLGDENLLYIQKITWDQIAKDTIGVYTMEKS